MSQASEGRPDGGPTEGADSPPTLPAAEDVSHDYLIRPKPPSHEFRFGIRTILVLTLLVAILCALISWLLRSVA